MESEIELSRIKFLLDDPLVLQNLIIEEKARCFDLSINLPIPTDQTCQAILWSRLHLAYLSDRFEMRLTRRNDETVVILNTLAFASQFSTFSTNVKNLRDWTGVPSFVKELVQPLVYSDCAYKYALLIYDEIYGWELIGCLPTFDSPIPESQDMELFQVKVRKLLHSFLLVHHIVLPLLHSPPLVFMPAITPLFSFNYILYHSSWNPPTCLPMW